MRRSLTHVLIVIITSLSIMFAIIAPMMLVFAVDNDSNDEIRIETVESEKGEEAEEDDEKIVEDTEQTDIQRSDIPDEEIDEDNSNGEESKNDSAAANRKSAPLLMRSGSSNHQDLIIVDGESVVQDDIYLTPHIGKFDSSFLMEINYKGEVTYYKDIPHAAYLYRHFYNEKGQERYAYVAVSGHAEYIRWGALEKGALTIMDENHNVIRDNIKGIGYGSVPDGFHIDPHEYVVFDDDHYLLFMAVPMLVTNVPGYEGQEIFVFNNVIQEQKNGKVVFQWESIDHPELYDYSFVPNSSDWGKTLTDKSIAMDYAHFNSVDFFDDGDLLVSFRKIGLVRIDKDTKDIVWVIGDKRNDFEFEKSKEPYLQHDARIMNDGSIKIYDNRDENHGLPRVLKLWLNEKTMSLSDYAAYELPNYGASKHMGSAQLLDADTETYLVTYGSGYDTGFEILDLPENEVKMSLKFASGDDTYAITQGLYKFKYPKKLVKSLSVSPTKKDVYAGSSFTIKATVTPSDAQNKTLTWSSSKPDVATVDKNGKVTAKKKGTTIIRVKTNGGSDIVKTVKVNVKLKTAAVSFNKLRLYSVKQSNNSIELKWTKLTGASKYVIYGNACGKKNKLKKIATSAGKSYNVKKLKKGTYYKYQIIALDKYGNQLSKSCMIHVATKGGKVGNHKKVAVTKSVLTKAQNLKKGKTLNLKAKAVVQSKKLSVKKHATVLRYQTTNKNIATVSGKGVITAKGKGTCYVYAYAQSGVYKTIKVVVK